MAIPAALAADLVSCVACGLWHRVHHAFPDLSLRCPDTRVMLAGLSPCLHHGTHPYRTCRIDAGYGSTLSWLQATYGSTQAGLHGKANGTAWQTQVCCTTPRHDRHPSTRACWLTNACSVTYQNAYTGTWAEAALSHSPLIFAEPLSSLASTTVQAAASPSLT